MGPAAVEAKDKEAVDWKFWGLFASSVLLLGCCVMLTQRQKVIRKNLVSVQDNYLDMLGIKVGDRLPNLTMLDAKSQPVEVTFGSSEPWRMIHVNRLDCAASFKQTEQWWDQLNIEPTFLNIQKIMVIMSRTVDAEQDFDPKLFPGLVVSPADLQTFSRAYRLLKTPTFLLISPEGKVEWSFIGIFTDEEYGALVETVISQRPHLASVGKDSLVEREL